MSSDTQTLSRPSSQACLSTDTKRLRGQFFTTTNPFNLDPFHKWFKSIPCFNEAILLEPFAGANNIVGMIMDLGYKNSWSCYDIEPVNSDDNATGIPVAQRDTLSDYPQGFHIAITNPPYLAKNSATRRGMPFPDTKHDDLYKLSLEVMLAETPYVAAIIPESFITQGMFHSRLHAVISLTCKMFEDTEVPVCLALFVPESEKEDRLNFSVYSENRLIGTYSSLISHLTRFEGKGIPWKFNDSKGQIGLYAIDSQKCASIRFLEGERVPEADVKESSRSVTRISADLPPEIVSKVIKEANTILSTRREATKDTFMTAFKGLRQDGRYRRRLDFAQAREILNLAAQNAGVLHND